ncbi:putative alpha/beta hydrolase [Tanacetum coccineum]
MPATSINTTYMQHIKKQKQSAATAQILLPSKGTLLQLAGFGYEEEEDEFKCSSLDDDVMITKVDPAQALNVPIVPLGAMLTAVYSLTSRPPYSLAWLNHMISTQDIMDPDLLKKLVLKNFCTIPAKLLLQLASAFKERGLSDRSGTFFYQEHIHKINVPILVVASDQDAICPLKLYKLPSQDMAPIGMEDGG